MTNSIGIKVPLGCMVEMGSIAMDEESARSLVDDIPKLILSIANRFLEVNSSDDTLRVDRKVTADNGAAVLTVVRSKRGRDPIDMGALAEHIDAYFYPPATATAAAHSAVPVASGGQPVAVVPAPPPGRLILHSPPAGPEELRELVDACDIVEEVKIKGPNGVRVVITKPNAIAGDQVGTNLSDHGLDGDSEEEMYFIIDNCRVEPGSSDP